MRTLKIGASGPDVVALQQRLTELGFPPGSADGRFGPGTQAAVMAFQRSEGMLPDGIVGSRTARAMELAQIPTVVSAVPLVTVEIVSSMFPHTPLRNIKTHLPTVLGAMVEPELVDKPMVLMALATIRAETEGFEPIDEFQSRFNTSPSGHPFDLYDKRRDLGNQGSPDGARYKGRGFIQLTGRSNYQIHGAKIGAGNRLLEQPDLANEPVTAARLLASFLKSKELAIKEAILEGDLRTARRLVNGGSHGIDKFVEAFRTGERLIPDELQAVPASA